MPCFRKLRALAGLVVCLGGCGGAASSVAPATPAGSDTDAEGEGPPVPEALAAEAQAASDAARAWMSEAAARPVEPTCELAPVHFTWAYEWNEETAQHEPAIDPSLGAEALSVIDWDLRCLAAHGASTVEVTGMIWALGSEEYAMALGDRLARGVRDALVARGMSRSDVRTRSFGEERATGHDALGWTRDVRVELR